MALGRRLGVLLLEAKLVRRPREALLELGARLLLLAQLEVQGRAELRQSHDGRAQLHERVLLLRKPTLGRVGREASGLEVAPQRGVRGLLMRQAVVQRDELTQRATEAGEAVLLLGPLPCGLASAELRLLPHMLRHARPGGLVLGLHRSEGVLAPLGR
jgi:hypothetical protein